MYAVESVVECTLFVVASITLIVLWKRFNEHCEAYIPEQDLATLKKYMYIYISAYTLSSIGDAIVDMLYLPNGVTRFCMAIIVLCALDLSTVGVTIYLNHLTTKVWRLKSIQ